MLRLLLALFLLPIGLAAQLEGVIDLHVHCAPDSGPRSVDAIEVARMAQRHGMRALLFKNHFTQTAAYAYLVSQVVPGVRFYGGIVLNRSVGGINPEAVERMAAVTGGHGKVVWMPTFDSEHYHKVFQPNPKFVPISRDGKLLPEVEAVLDVMAKHGLTLATGHSSPAESLLLIRAAAARGIAHIIVTHPLPKPVGMTIEQQKEAARLGALLEYPFNATLPPTEQWPGGHVSIDGYAEAIRAVGPANVVLSSDLGQPLNPVHTDGLIGYLSQLLERGFSQAEIETMSRINPARFLGLN